MNRLIGLALVCVMATCAEAQSWKNKDKAPEKTKGWTDNFEQAKKEAAALKQPIFALFTGSDWCPWCIRLRSEALDKKEFQKFAADNLILFEADFPQQKQLSEKVKRQNAELSKTYGVRGYPSVILLDADGKQLGKTGYQEGGADAYVKHIKDLLDKAGVKTTDKADVVKSASAYDKMKAAKTAKTDEKK